MGADTKRDGGPNPSAGVSPPRMRFLRPVGVTAWDSDVAAPRILVAEDDDEVRRFLVALLRGDGYDVVEAEDGRALLEALARQLEERVDPIDLIISDLRMPDINGLEVLGCLQRAEWKTPFILVTAFGSESITNEALRRGAAAIFDKPFDVDRLRSEIVRCVGRRRASVTPSPRES